MEERRNDGLKKNTREYIQMKQRKRTCSDLEYLNNRPIECDTSAH